MNVQGTANMQNTARNFLHVVRAPLHHDCTTVQKVNGANLSTLHHDAPHPLRGGAVVQWCSAAVGASTRNSANGRNSADSTKARFSARSGLMRTNPESAINDLLRAWHRWSSAPARVVDTRMADFDAVLAEVPPGLRAALQVQARNLAVGAAVFASARAGDLDQARAFLRALLADDEDRWFGLAEVTLNERGNRIGQSNPKAELSDADVELLLQLREEGYTYAWLAAKFEIAKSTVGSWVTGRTRGQTPVRTKKVTR